jgi:hypothetical protein
MHYIKLASASSFEEQLEQRAQPIHPIFSNKKTQEKLKFTIQLSDLLENNMYNPEEEKKW